MQKIMRYLIVLLFAFIISCDSPDNTMLYSSEHFKLYSDRVEQGNYVAKVLDRDHIISNYQSPANENFLNVIQFKFSINQKDNELPIGVNHRMLVQLDENGKYETPVIKFGQSYMAEVSQKEEAFLPTNVLVKIQLDFREVLADFKKKGYYETYDGTRVAANDFKGVYIAGGSAPLTWDFVNLDKYDGLTMLDKDQDGIYETTIKLNPYNEEDLTDQEWQLSNDLSKFATYNSDQKIVDALYNLSLEETILNSEDDGTFRTGAKWPGVWTRDVSYSIMLAYAYLEPQIAKTSLLRKVRRDRIVQDTGSGGAWPISSDRTTWVLAAWEIYKVTGDQEWLSQAFTIIKNTVEDDLKTLKAENGLFMGESSFLDWREQTYPRWMDNKDIFASQSLGTNAVHYQTYTILAQMADILGEPSQRYVDEADKIKEAINNLLWLEDKGYYAQYTYGRKSFMTSGRFEALGESFMILFDIADVERKKQILSSSPHTPYGVTCIYPQIPAIPPYHNDGIWPFVQAYWNWAAAQTGNEKALKHGLASIYRASALFLTNKENFVAQNGDFQGTEINSDRQLWSVAGNLAMVYRVFMGINFEQDGIRFSPSIPEVYEGVKSLKGFKYREAKLDITVKGYGNQIASITMDGKPLSDGFFHGNVTGNHEITITMDNRPFGIDGINLVDNAFSPETPIANLQNNVISWRPVEGSTNYKIYKNGELISETSDTSVEIPDAATSFYRISAVDKDGMESFTSEPIVYGNSEVQIVEIETSTSDINDNLSGYSGGGAVLISKEGNREISIDLEVSEEGNYLLDMRYSNGSGPWNTDNKCAIRSIYVNNEYKGVLVFPQRGADEWSDWGFSNSLEASLKQGKNQVTIRFEEWNENMNVDVNRALIDYLRVLKLD